MIIPFRQGIVRIPTALTGPNWLQKTSLSGASIDLNVAQESVVLTFAHYGADYLFEESSSIVGAWGGDSIGSVNGPLTAGGVTQWLFWDVDLGTGALTRGWTLVAPIVSVTEPTNPVADMHWFDLSTNRMRLYRVNSIGAGIWIDKIRLFAAKYDSSATIQPINIGSQVSYSNGSYSSGNLLLGANNKPLKQSDGTFVTTESDLIVYQTSGQNVRFDAALVYAQAAEDIPKFSMVSFLPGQTMQLASNLNLTLFASGIVLADHYKNEMGQVITTGMVRNEQWDWQDANINGPLFVGVAGELSLVPPPTGVMQKVGFIVDNTSIFVQLQPPVRLK